MKHVRPSTKLHSNHGFTIVELMIATTVFSMVILLLMAGVIEITRNYYKGIVESNTQNTARDVINSVAQTIQFSSSATQTPIIHNAGSGAYSWICVGNQQFTFVLGNELIDSTTLGPHQANHVLVLTQILACPASVSAFPAGRELLNTHMRVSQLSVAQQGSTNFYTIDVRVVYGDDDLLVGPTGTNANCSGLAGSQFCATAELQSVVEQRQT